MQGLSSSEPSVCGLCGIQGTQGITPSILPQKAVARTYKAMRGMLTCRSTKKLGAPMGGRECNYLQLLVSLRYYQREVVAAFKTSCRRSNDRSSTLSELLIFHRYGTSSTPYWSRARVIVFLKGNDCSNLMLILLDEFAKN